MKPLFTGFFCPNDCDKPHQRAPQRTSWKMLLPKIPTGEYSFFTERATSYRGRDWFIWLDTDDEWHCYQSMSNRQESEAILIIGIGPNGDASIQRSKKGYRSISDIPDYDD